MHAMQAGQGPSIEKALAIAETSPELQAAVGPAIAAFLDATADFTQQHGHLPALASPDALLRARMLAGRCAGLEMMAACTSQHVACHAMCNVHSMSMHMQPVSGRHREQPAALRAICAPVPRTAGWPAPDPCPSGFPSTCSPVLAADVQDIRGSPGRADWCTGQPGTGRLQGALAHGSHPCSSS